MMSTLDDSVVTHAILPPKAKSPRPAGARIRAVLCGVGEALVAAKRRRATLEILHGLDDRMLQDIGLLRGQIGASISDLPARWR